MQSFTSSLLAVPSALLQPTTTTAKQSLLQPHDGAPLSGATELVPAKYLSSIPEKELDKEKEKVATPPLPSPGSTSQRGRGKDSSLSQGITTALSPSIVRADLPTFARAPPSQLLDAPARAALNMPNQMTAHGQARAVRGSDPRTPEYEVNGAGVLGGAAGPGQYRDQTSGQNPGQAFHATVQDASSGESTPLIAPQARYAYAGRTGSSTEDYLTGGSNYLSASGMGGGGGGYDSDNGEGLSTGHNISRPSSAQSTSSSRNILRRIFIDRASTPSQHLSRPTFPPPSASTYSPRPPGPLSLGAKLNLFINQTISVGLSTVFLAFVVSWAMAGETARRLPRWIWPGKGKKFPWDDDQYWRKEGRKISKDPRDYARQVGMDIEHQTVETEDGYLLKMHKVIDPTHKPLPNGKPPFPVLILHGLFQSSGSFVTSEERSLAFWLARQGGYSVYLGNTRGVFDMGHRNLSRGDPRFWDWTIRELAMYDLPALVEHVCRETGYDKIAFIGHSQGNGLAFISLSLGMCPNLGKKLSCFIALAPAVYAGPLTTGFPFTALNRLEWGTWKRFFGVLDFIPLMRWAYDWAPAKLFAMLGYTMFAFLFSWTDANWLHRRKTKMFRFTPTPVSSASIFWWCGKGGFADRKCTLDDSLERWFDDRFPPLSIYYGGRDYLVLTEPLLERLERKERDVRVLKVTKLEESEHCDFYWAAEAVEWAYESFVDDIERTRPKDKSRDDPEDKREHQNGGEVDAQGGGDGTAFKRDPRVGVLI